jgi:hypothetical protein
LWTLTYFYADPVTGNDVNVANIVTETTPFNVSAHILLAGVRKVYSRQDPTRPLLKSPGAALLSDQVVGDMPLASTTLYGKAKLAADLDTASGEVVQGNDQRVNTPIQALAARFSTLQAGLNVSFANLGANILEIASATFSVAIYDLSWMSGGALPKTTGAIPFTPKFAIFSNVCYTPGNPDVGHELYHPTVSLGFATSVGVQRAIAKINAQDGASANGCTGYASVVAGSLLDSDQVGGVDGYLTNFGAGVTFSVTQFTAAGIIVTASGNVQGRMQVLVVG